LLLRRGERRLGSLRQTFDEVPGLAPEDRVEFLDMAESKSRHEILPLLLVLIALCKQNAHTQDPRKTFAEMAGLDEFIVLQKMSASTLGRDLSSHTETNKP
jgi:hypothetical protein